MNKSASSDVVCPHCGSTHTAYEGMYEMNKMAGIILLPDSAQIYRCTSCKKLFFVHDTYIHQARHIKINIQEWKQKLGDDLLTCLIIWCIGLNRLYALLDILVFSDNFDKSRLTARHDRNYVSSLLMTFGILHELDHNLDSMMPHLKNKNGPVGIAIKRLKKVYSNNKKLRVILTEYRDKISYHFDNVIIKNQLSQLSEGQVGFIKFDSQIDRDVYYEFEEISNRGFVRQFFPKEIEEHLEQGKTFEEIWPLLFDKFVQYISNVHYDILKKGHGLVNTFISEYKLGFEVVDDHK